MKNSFHPAAALAAAVAIASAAPAADEDAWIKDLMIEQVGMAEIAPPDPPAGTAGGLAVTAAVDRPSRVYTQGDPVVLTVTATEDSYIWVFDTGTSGKVHQIFPNRYETGNFLAAGRTLRIPGTGSDYAFSVSHPTGVELITVIASKDATPITADLIDEDADAGPFLVLAGTGATVSKDLAITLKEEHPTWTRDHVAFLIE